MSVNRACQPCRVAKAKCDLVRPSCGRCTRRQLSCSGYPADSGFIFLDENERARRNSERARRSPRADQGNVVPVPTVREQQSHSSSVGISNAFFRQHYPWLSSQAVAEVPGPLRRDLETRAVERFFVNWILHPRNDGMSPGYMHDLPTLYLSAPPESALWLVIRATAFADMRDARTESAPFHIKARRHYGASLASMRNIANEEQNLTDDHVLAAILFIDCFELIYLGRNWQSRPHDSAIKHILRARGEAQLFDRTGFALWSAAHHRLQAHQILLREEPNAEQKTLLSKLNINQTDIHLSADLLQISILVAAAKKLTHNNQGSESNPPDKIEEIRGLAESIEDFIRSIEHWTAAVSGIWKPEVIDHGQFEDTREVDNPPGSSVPSFISRTMLSYRDLWLAYLWNIHTASQIVLRESLVEVINYGARLGSLEDQAADPTVVERIVLEREAIEKLSSTVMQSFPLLMGFVDIQPHEPRWSQHGKMAGRYFCIFSMWIVSQAHFTPPSHKETAVKVLEWINSSHGLG